MRSFLYDAHREKCCFQVNGSNLLPSYREKLFDFNYLLKSVAHATQHFIYKWVKRIPQICCLQINVDYFITNSKSILIRAQQVHTYRHKRSTTSQMKQYINNNKCLSAPFTWMQHSSDFIFCSFWIFGALHIQVNCSMLLLLVVSICVCVCLCLCFYVGCTRHRRTHFGFGAINICCW